MPSEAKHLFTADDSVEIEIPRSARNDNVNGHAMENLFSTARVFIYVLAVGLFSMAVRNSIDPDVWWHLRTGQLIFENHAVPHTDPFSFTRNGSPWVAHEWLSELLFYGLYRLGGIEFLTVVFAGVIAAAFLINYYRCAGRPYIAGVVTVVSAVATIPTWGVRPQVLSLLLASAFLLVLDRSEENPKLLWWLPALMLVWVNLHGAFALGIGLIGFYAIGAGIEWVQGKAPQHSGFSRLRNLSLTLFGCLVAVPLNPNGWRMYAYPFETLRSRALQSYISEWRAPDFHLGRFYAFAGLLVLTLVFLVLSRRRPRVHEVLLVLVTALAGLHSVRHIPIFALVAAPLISERLRGWLSRWRGLRALIFPNLVTSAGARVANVFLVLALAAFATVHVHDTLRNLDKTENKDFPVAAATFLREHTVPQPLLNYYDWGGYLIWRLYPEYRVWVDGRTDLYGDRFMDEYLAMSFAENGWKLRLREWGIESVIFPAHSRLTQALLRDGSWREIYGDQQAVVLSRVTKD